MGNNKSYMLMQTMPKLQITGFCHQERTHFSPSLFFPANLWVFEKPSIWCDSRKTKGHSNFPDIDHTTGGETLFIDTSCSKWTQLGINSFPDSSLAPGQSVRARIKKIGEAAFRSGHVTGQNRFLTLSERNKLIWQHTKCGQPKEALQIYKEMREQGMPPNSYTFVAVLKACIILDDLEAGKEIHRHVTKTGDQIHIFIANALVDMYAKCGSMAHARRVFERMPHHDIVSWNTIITGYAQREEGDLALQLYERMQHEGFRPNGRTFVAALKACSSLAIQEESEQLNGELVKIRCLEKGRAIHSQILLSGFETDIFVANTLVDMYANCGSMVDACMVFENMLLRNVVTWTAMIMGYAQLDKGESALQIYACMQHEGFIPNSHTFVAVLKACSSLAVREEGKQVNGTFMKLGCLEKGRMIHSQVVWSGFEGETFVSNALMDMYAKCGNMLDAAHVFESLLHRDVVSWTAMIMGYAQMEKGEVALQFYARMQCEGCTPVAHTFAAALKACSSLAVQEEGRQIDGELVKIGCLQKGRAIHSQVVNSVFKLDIFVASTLVDMYVKCGSLVDARKVFENMPHRDVVLWTAIIMGYAQMGKGDLALQLYARMQQEGFIPNAYTFVAALVACASLASLETGKEIHAELCRLRLEGETFVANCLIDMYGKCGSMVDAQRLFDAAPARDVVTWSALIAGYSSQGDSERVFNLFVEMEKEDIQPGGITFLSVLTACSHTGLVEKGQSYFQAMCSNYGITPSSEHYSCMVDLLGRAGQLDEAMAMVKKMPLKPNIVTWKIILGACQKWNKVEIGRHAFECVVSFDGTQAGVYLSMTNIYASAHMWEESANIQERRTDAQAWKKQK